MTTSTAPPDGRAARSATPRSSLADIGADEGRDPLGILAAQDATRVPELVPIRHGRMVASPFAFFRGAAAIMAADLGAAPSTGIRAQLCGDAHLANFGAFASPERRLVFDLNDFDETLPGPFEWDVKRLATSFVVAAREKGLGRGHTERLAGECARVYRESMAALARMGELEVWYRHVDVDEIMTSPDFDLTKRERKRLAKGASKARRRDSEHAFAKLTRDRGGGPHIVAEPPLIVPLDDLATEFDRATVADAVHETLREYARSLVSDRRHVFSRFRLADIAHKVVGVGSVGTRCWIALMLGQDHSEPLFLQLKEAQPSVLEPYAGRSAYRNPGHRVVAGQRLMQAVSDIFLGYRNVFRGPDGQERAYYVRQLRDWKGSADVERMDPPTLAAYARLCAYTLARAHARSGPRGAIAAYLGKGDRFDRAMVDYAEAYADRNASDHAALREAIDRGRVAAEEGV